MSESMASGDGVAEEEVAEEEDWVEVDGETGVSAVGSTLLVLSLPSTPSVNVDGPPLVSHVPVDAIDLPARCSAARARMRCSCSSVFLVHSLFRGVDENVLKSLLWLKAMRSFSTVT